MSQASSRVVTKLATSHYDILGLTPSASVVEIRSAYRTLILLNHPDRINTNTSTSHTKLGAKSRSADQLNIAWEILGNERSKEEYDRNLIIRKCELYHSLLLNM